MIYFTSDLHLGHKTEEVWRDVVGYEGLYQVSNIGRVKRLAHTREISPKGYKQIVSYKEKIISPCRTDRYIQLQLSKNGKKQPVLVHRLVAEAFIPNPNNLPCVNHKDENKHNNCADNLEWCTQKYNLNYGEGYKIHTHLMRTRHGKAVDQYDKNGKFITTYDCANDVEPEYSVSHVISCCKKKRKSHKNFIWVYHGETPVIPDRR